MSLVNIIQVCVYKNRVKCPSCNYRWRAFLLASIFYETSSNVCSVIFNYTSKAENEYLLEPFLRGKRVGKEFKRLMLKGPMGKKCKITMLGTSGCETLPNL